MAIFISHSRQDLALAHEARRRLEADQLEVFDAASSIRIGEEWQSSLQKALRGSDAVIAIITENYLGSRFASYEALAAIEDAKLIPIVFGTPRLTGALAAVAYIDGNSRDWPSKMMAAIYALRQKKRNTPQQEHAPSRGRIGTLALHELRVQSLYWLGVGGAVITLAGNLDAFMTFATWLEWINLHWGDVLTWFWNFLVPFDIRVFPEDAVVFTLLAVLFFNLVLTSNDANRSVAPVGFIDGVVLSVGVLVTAYLGFVGFIHEVDAQQVGITDRTMAPLLAVMRGVAPTQFESAIVFVGVTVTGATALVVAYVPIAYVFTIRPNMRAFGARIWRIIFGVVLVAFANQVSVSIEAHNWG